MSAQKAKWTGHGRANIYTGGGFYMSKLFMGTAPRASTFSHVPIPSPISILTIPFYVPPSKKPGHCTLWRPARSYIAPITVKLGLWVKHKSIYNWNWVCVIQYAVDLRSTKWPIKSPIIPLKLSSVGVVTKFTGAASTETEPGKQSTIDCSHRRLLLAARAN